MAGPLKGKVQRLLLNFVTFTEFWHIINCIYWSMTFACFDKLHYYNQDHEHISSLEDFPHFPLKFYFFFSNLIHQHITTAFSTLLYWFTFPGMWNERNSTVFPAGFFCIFSMMHVCHLFIWHKYMNVCGVLRAHVVYVYLGHAGVVPV